MKIVYFDYSSICILIIILFSIFLNKSTKGKSNRAFIFLILEVLSVCIVGSITLNLDNAGPGNVAAKYFFHNAYLFLHNMTALFFLNYIVSVADIGHTFKLPQYFFITFPSVVMVLLLCVNNFFPCVFYVDPNDVYTKLSCMPILYVIAFINLFIGFSIFIKYKRLFNFKIMFSVLWLFGITCFAIIFESIFPKIVVEPFANTIGILFISFNIQRSEQLIHVYTGLKNSLAYEEDCFKAAYSDKKFNQIFVNITNYSLIKEIIGYDKNFKLPAIVAKTLNNIDIDFRLNAEIYYLGKGRFRIITERKKFEQTISAAYAINEELKKTITYKDTEINPIANVCVARCPEDIKDYDSFIIFGNDMNLSKFHNGNVLYASDLYKEDYYQKLQNIDKIIERNLATKNFQVYYQPIYSLKEHRFTSAEALLRLNDPEFGFIPPDIFIPAAENSGDIHKIDSFVLEEVCSFVSSEKFKQTGLKYIEVNLSVAHCMQDNLPEQVFATLRRFNVKPEMINLEITETAVAQSQEKLLKNLLSLVNFGINISLDDFGSGYSNLQRISQLPLSIVKIDKTFTDSVKINKVSIILQNLIRMVQALHLQIVVEGVETEEVMNIFNDYGCDYIQGFFFSRPLPKDDFVQFIEEY